MSDTPQILLAHHLKALRLPTFLREYDEWPAPNAHQIISRVGCGFRPPGAVALPVS